MWRSFVVSCRSMKHLAYRFTEGVNDAFVVDPLFDQRYRFKDKLELSKMLKARGIESNVDELETNYIKWWQAYENLRRDSEDKKRKAACKAKLRSLNSGLLDVLQLPNDIASCSYEREENLSAIMRPKTMHSEHLYAAGMLKSTTHPPSLNIIGYPVLLSFLLQQFFIDGFTAIGILVSPPSFVRAAVIEGVNIPLENYLSFSDGSNDTFPMYLVGRGLVSLVSLFVRKVISYRSTEDPLRVFTVGSAYNNLISSSSCAEGCCLSKLDLLSSPQHTKVAIMSVCAARQEELDEYRFMKEYINDMMLKFGLDLKFKRIIAKELYNYESEAESLIYENIELVRISRSGEYIPRRLNIVMKGKERALHFATLNYAEIDITSVLAVLFEENMVREKTDIPEFLKKYL